MTVEPNNDARYQRGYVPDAEAGIRKLPASASQPTASAEVVDTDSMPAPEVDALLDQFEPRNPFIIALWIVGPALTVGGPLLQTRSLYESYSGTSRSFTSDDIPFDIVLQQLTYSLSPSMAGAGLATIVGLIFLKALRWRSRPSRRSDT